MNEYQIKAEFEAILLASYSDSEYAELSAWTDNLIILEGN